MPPTLKLCIMIQHKHRQDLCLTQARHDQVTLLLPERPKIELGPKPRKRQHESDFIVEMSSEGRDEVVHERPAHVRAEIILARLNALEPVGPCGEALCKGVVLRDARRHEAVLARHAFDFREEDFLFAVVVRGEALMRREAVFDEVPVFGHGHVRRLYVYAVDGADDAVVDEGHFRGCMCVLVGCAGLVKRSSDDGDRPRFPLILLARRHCCGCGSSICFSESGSCHIKNLDADEATKTWRSTMG